MIGGGVKAPTGKFRYVDDGTEVANANFQLGTGSVDFMLNAIYNVRPQQVGRANLDATYKINTQIRQPLPLCQSREWFGICLSDTYALSADDHASMWAYIQNILITEQENGLKNTFLGGVLSTANVGLELYFQKISAGITYQTPLYQRLSDGDLKLKNSFSVHLTKLF